MAIAKSDAAAALIGTAVIVSLLSCLKRSKWMAAPSADSKFICLCGRGPPKFTRALRFRPCSAIGAALAHGFGRCARYF
jgi:hypothetical protein